MACPCRRSEPQRSSAGFRPGSRDGDHSFAWRAGLARLPSGSVAKSAHAGRRDPGLRQSPMHSLNAEGVRFPGPGRLTGIHVSHSQEKSTSLRFALWRARSWTDQELALRTFASRRVVPHSAEPDIHLLPRAPWESSQKIEFGFSASPETIRREPQESPPSPSRSSAGPGSLRIDNPDGFSFSGKVLRCRGSSELGRGHLIRLASFYRQHQRHHLPCHRERGPVAVAALAFLFVE